MKINPDFTQDYSDLAVEMPTDGLFPETVVPHFTHDPKFLLAVDLLGACADQHGIKPTVVGHEVLTYLTDRRP